MTTFLVSLTSIVVALVAAWATAILAEDYRRFRDGTSLAAALAGELQAYIEAFDTGLPTLHDIRKELKKGAPLKYMPPFKPPGDPVYESGVERLGLLGPEIARDVAYTYQQVNAFRASYVNMTETYSKVEQFVVLGSLEGVISAATKALDRGNSAIQQLDARARATYWLFPWPRPQPAPAPTSAT
ncbi:hypothetical protein [Rhodanobacter sp. C05]|uniref:hypothetical protein n=1 Tax=Rhodanobacter sp. C05 TaxID=1945855 RepID=UPI0009857BB3|nr:hypothetical protein [Rhodanobacter sp. C05]OOG42682.1 hypothetical protein B0E51_04335 [Rhodanobacter sp. C05]